MHTKKILSVITASALMMGALSSCALLENLEKPHVQESLNNYLDAVHGAEFEDASELVEDQEDAFILNEMSDTELELITAILAASEFEIGEIEIDGESASTEVTLTLPDIESIAGEGYSYDEFLEAIGDLEDTTDETLDFELNKIDDAWLIEPDCTEDYYELLTGLIADLEFTRLTEENALATVDAFIALMGEGDLTGANAMVLPNGSQFSSYLLMASTLPGISDLLTSYCGRLTYTSEVTEVTDEYIIVSVNGTAPDVQAVLDAVLDNEDVMVPLYADYIEATVNGQDPNMFLLSVASTLMDAASSELETVQDGPVEFTFKVTESENGDLMLEVTGGPEVSIDMDELASRTDYIVPALAQLLSDGRITLDQVLELREMYGV